MNKQASVADVTKSMTDQLSTVGDKLQAQFTAKATTVINKGIASLKGIGASDDEIIRSVKACDKPLKACGYLDPNWLLNHLLREAGFSQRGERNDKGKAKKKKSTTKGGPVVSGKSTNATTTKVVTTADELSKAGAASALSNLQTTLQLLKKLSAKELDIVALQLEKYRCKEAANLDMRTKGSVLTA
jgi:hypothetical protein